MDQVTYVTSFGQFGRDSYAHVADRKGFFAEQGIKLSIQKGTGTDGVKHVATRRADFAAVDFAGGTIQVAKNDLDVRAVALIHKQTLAAIMAKESDHIITPKDLEGKVIADFPASVVKMLFRAYATLAKIDYTKVRWRDTDPQTLLAALNVPEVDAISQFVVGKATVEAVTKTSVSMIPYSTYLSDLPGNALWVNGGLLRSNPDLVRRFRTALLKGLAWAVQHPDEAGQILREYDRTANQVLAATEVRLMAPYVGWQPGDDPDQLDPTRLADLGRIDSSRIARAIAILQGAGAIDAGLTPDRLTVWDLPEGPGAVFRPTGQTTDATSEPFSGGWTSGAAW